MKSSLRSLAPLLFVALLLAGISAAPPALANPEIEYIVTTPTDPIKPTQTLEFDVTVHNLTASSQPVTLDWSVPKYTLYNCCDGEGTPESHDFGTLAAGASVTWQLRLTVLDSNSVPDGSIIQLMLTDTMRGVSVPPRTVLVKDAPVLQLDLSTEQASVASGENLVYTLAASNISLGSVSGTTLTFTLPAGVTFISADGDGQFNAGTVTWDLGTLGPGANEQVHVTLQAASSVPIGPFEALLSDNSGDSAAESDARVVIAAPVVQYTVTAVQDAIRPSQVLEYDVTVHNLSGSSQPVKLDWSVPEHTLYNCCSTQGSAQSHDFGTLAAGATVTWQLRLTVLDTNTVPEGASVTVHLFDLSRAASIARTVVIREAPALELALATEQGTVAPNSNFTYTLVASNASLASLTGVTLSATVPAGASFISADNGGTLSNGVVTWNLATLVAGANKQVHVTLQAGSGAPPLGPLDAIVFDNNGDIAQSSDTRVLSAAPVFQYVLTTIQDPMKPGQILEYDVTVHNLTGSSQTVKLDWSVPEYTFGELNISTTASRSSASARRIFIPSKAIQPFLPWKACWFR